MSFIGHQEDLRKNNHKMSKWTLLMLIVSLLFLSANAMVSQTKVSALYVFGDSTVDAGNNNRLKTITKANAPPYGKDFPGHIATGRFSNGKIAIDFVSEHLGLPDTVKAYLDPDYGGERLLTGADFASGASGLYDGTPRQMNVLSIDEELKLFRRYKSQLIAMAGQDNATNIISKGLFVISTGTVDFTNVYFTDIRVQKMYSISQYQDIILKKLQQFIENVYKEGARRLVVFGLPPFGCLPIMITAHNLLNNTCSDYLNEVALSTNTKLKSLISSLTFTNLHTIYVETYGPLLDFSLNPTKYGFVEARKGCCGSGVFETMTFLGCSPFTPSCPEASKYVYFDGYHPTTAAYKLHVESFSFMQEYVI